MRACDAVPLSEPASSNRPNETCGTSSRLPTIFYAELLALVPGMQEATVEEVGDSHWKFGIHES